MRMSSVLSSEINQIYLIFKQTYKTSLQLFRMQFQPIYKFFPVEKNSIKK